MGETLRADSQTEEISVQSTESVSNESSENNEIVFVQTDGIQRTKTV